MAVPMKPNAFLQEYWNERLSGEDLRMQLAKDDSRQAREALEILSVEESCRGLLKAFGPSPEIVERLVEKVVAVESWVPLVVQGRKTKLAPSNRSFSGAVAALDVIGHSESIKTVKKKKESLVDRQSRRRRKPRPDVEKGE
jgi:hypothetical protein